MIQNNDALRGVLAELYKIRRTAEMSAAIMRDPLRTGGWEGAEKVARSFERLSERVAEVGAALRQSEPPAETAPSGAQMWRGIGKLIEEAGEVMQLCGKIVAFPTSEHPDGEGDLQIRITDEMADLYAALDYFAETNGLNASAIGNRRVQKLDRLRGWVLSGLPIDAAPLRTTAAPDKGGRT